MIMAVVLTPRRHCLTQNFLAAEYLAGTKSQQPDSWTVQTIYASCSNLTSGGTARYKLQVTRVYLCILFLRSFWKIFSGPFRSFPARAALEALRSSALALPRGGSTRGSAVGSGRSGVDRARSFPERRLNGWKRRRMTWMKRCRICD